MDVAACRNFGVGLVRRPTGGSAIYHDGPERELTYSVIASSDDLGIPVDVLATYRWIALALVRGLRALGAPAEIVAVPETDGPAPDFCFARTGRYEIEVEGRKLVGSAQRRHGRAFLQHGSILLAVDAPGCGRSFRRPRIRWRRSRLSRRPWATGRSSTTSPRRWPRHSRASTASP